MSAAPTDPHVGLVVEGPGDLKALPIVLRKHLQATGEFRDVLGKPVPANGRSKALVPRGLEGYVATAALRPGCVGVLVVLDGEGDCVAHLGPELLARSAEDSPVPVSVALADRDFEDWIYASAETLGIGIEPYNPARKGQAAIKAALKPRAYVKPVFQPRLAARIDFTLATARNPSFARLLDRFDQLRGLLPPPQL
mgnify:CR=1 FL=1